VRATKNEHRISRVSLSEAMNVIYISTDAADLGSSARQYKWYMLSKDSYPIIAEALGSTVSHNIMHLSICLPVSMLIWVQISMYIVYLSAGSLVA